MNDMKCMECKEGELILIHKVEEEIGLIYYYSCDKCVNQWAVRMRGPKCKDCGERLSYDWKHCPHCGRSVK